MCSIETALNQSRIVDSIVKSDMMGTKSCRCRKEITLVIDGVKKTYIACTCKLDQFDNTPIGCSNANYLQECWVGR